MTDREAMQKAFEIIGVLKPDNFVHRELQGEAWDALRQALAQPEQEPAAWMVLTQDDKKLMLWGQEKPPIFDAPVKLIPLYTAPPRKTWVGLTDEEIKGILDCGRGGLVDIKKAEQILKEKNNAV